MLTQHEKLNALSVKINQLTALGARLQEKGEVLNRVLLDTKEDYTELLAEFKTLAGEHEALAKEIEFDHTALMQSYSTH